MRRFARCALAALTLAAATGAAARDEIPAELRTLPWKGVVPECDDPAVIGHIQRRFGEREDAYWRYGLRIAAVDRIHPIGFRTWGFDYIPRRYCVARALTSDGRYRKVSFVIIENGGMIGWSWGVEWCVSGLDRLYYYAPRCKMARP